MAKFCGKIGFALTMEVDPENSPGVWSDLVIERQYYGDITRMRKKLENTSNINDNINIDNIVNIVMDPFIHEHIFAIKYVKWNGVAWKVTSIDVEHPRMILTLGGIWNGETA